MAPVLATSMGVYAPTFSAVLRISANADVVVCPVELQFGVYDETTNMATAQITSSEVMCPLDVTGNVTNIVSDCRCPQL